MTIQFFTPIFTSKFWHFKSLYTKRLKCQPKDKSFKTQALCKTQVLAGSLLALTLTLNPANAGEVSVSNYPLYLLSQAVTQGKNDAEVLLRAGDVGHHGSLSPAKLKQVKDSQFVVWFGRELEQNLVNTLENSPNAITLFDFKSFHKKPLRDVDGKVIVGSFDPHIWLDPNNAKAIVAALTSIHSTAHPENKAFYEQNAKQFYQKMDKLSTQYKSKLSTPYWAYHDAFQYIEGALSLKFAGALTPDHHLSPKVSRFKVLQETRSKPTMCLASQLPVSDGIKRHLAPIKTLVRQEDMSDSDDFLSAWQGLAEEFVVCTSG